MILVFLWASERWDGSLALRIFDELCEPFQLRFFSLRTQDPECCYPLIPWSLRLEEAPSPLVGPKPFFEIAAQFSGLSLFIRVNRRPIIRPSLERVEPARLHPSKGDEFLDSFDVYCAPSAASLAWGKPIRIASITNTPSNTIDPAEAEGFVN